MKHSKIALAALVAISTAHFASAATSIVITGSTAFRAAATNGILNVFGASGNSLTGYAYNGSSVTGASYQTFQGNISGMSNPVTVKTSWSGSVAGIQSVATGVNVNVLPDSQTLTVGGTSGASTSSLTSVSSDIVFADNLQNSTPYSGLTTQTKIGIIPFAWVAGQSAISGVSNITTQLAKSLLTTGFVPASQFTGNSADTQILVAAGRDNLSGTRIAALSETGYGTQTLVTQYTPTAFGTGTSANVVSNINFTASGGNLGETSGGTLALYTRYNTSNVTDDSSAITLSNGTDPLDGTGTTSMSFIIYVGENDSYNAVFGLGTPAAQATGTNGAGNGKYLSYNGVLPFAGIAKRPSTATTTAGSAILTGLPSGTTTGLVVGQIVSGNFITGGSIISSIDTVNNTITLDRNVIGAGAPTNVQIGALIPRYIQQGLYTFWNYEYIGNKSLSSTKTPFFNALRDRVKNYDFGFSGLADDSSMLVSRTADGGVISLK